jgi:hypothetical protein
MMIKSDSKIPGVPNNWLCRKPDFVHLFVDLKKYEGDPLSPPEGEATQGVYPLDPLLQPGKPYER